MNTLLDEQLAAGLRGDFHRGWQIAEQLKRETPECNRAAFNRGWYEMMQGRLYEGMEALDRGRWENVYGSPPLRAGTPIYRDENLKDKFLLLRGEGGLGDQIIHARFAKDFADKGAKVIASCEPALASVISRIPGVHAVVHSQAAAQIHHDFWVPGMSAARILKYEYQDLSGKPYLSSTKESNQKWAKWFDENYPKNQKRIGLRFYGNPKFEHEQHRKFPRELMMNAIGDRPWVNLQIEETNLPIKTWEDTLGVLNHLDLVITSCTSVAHASAALGKQTWILVPLLPYYLWALPGLRSPWYASVTLFRQTKFDDWQDPFDRIAEKLTNFL